MAKKLLLLLTERTKTKGNMVDKMVVSNFDAV